MYLIVFSFADFTQPDILFVKFFYNYIKSTFFYKENYYYRSIYWHCLEMSLKWQNNVCGVIYFYNKNKILSNKSIKFILWTIFLQFDMKVSSNPVWVYFTEAISQNDLIFWILIKSYEIHNILKNYEKILQFRRVMEKRSSDSIGLQSIS